MFQNSFNCFSTLSLSRPFSTVTLTDNWQTTYRPLVYFQKIKWKKWNSPSFSDKKRSKNPNKWNYKAKIQILEDSTAHVISLIGEIFLVPPKGRTQTASLLIKSSHVVKLSNIYWVEIGLHNRIKINHPKVTTPGLIDLSIKPWFVPNSGCRVWRS